MRSKTEASSKALRLVLATSIAVWAAPSLARGRPMTPQASQDIYALCKRQTLAHSTMPIRLRFLNEGSNPRAVATDTADGGVQLAIELDIAIVNDMDTPVSASRHQCLISTRSNQIVGIDVIQR